MPDTYTDDNGNRVIIRHEGPPGQGLIPGGTPGQILAKAPGGDFALQWVNPPDGTGAVVGPASSLNNTIPVFDGTTGKLIKGSSVTLSSLALASDLSNKVDKVTGKALSTHDLTNGFKLILDTFKAQSVALGHNPDSGTPSFAISGFRGSYATAMALAGAVPLANKGDYAYVESPGNPTRMYVWDSANTTWRAYDSNNNLSASQIATLLFNPVDSAAYNQISCRIFTTEYKALVDQHESIIASLSGEISSAVSFGSLSYFNLTGVSPAIAAISDGLTNMVKIVAATTVSSTSTNFDNATDNNGRLRYTGSATRMFLVTAKVSLSGVTDDLMVLGIAKNASVLADSRVLKKMNAAGDTDSLTLSVLVSLATNDYLELYVGNTSTTDDPVIQLLTIEAMVQ